MMSKKSRGGVKTSSRLQKKNWANRMAMGVSVTSKIRKGVEKGEGLEPLRSVINSFPSNLERFTQRIISKGHNKQNEQIVQDFRAAIDEVRLLRLYAFALLEQEQSKPHLERNTIKKGIKLFKKPELEQQYEDLKLRLQNRCTYFLVINSQPYPARLSHLVNLSHRTVRDFLRDSYRQELDKFMTPECNPLITLCDICSALLRGSSIRIFKNPKALRGIVGLADKLLYYVHEVERRSCTAELPRLVPILNETDRTNEKLSQEVATVGTRLVFQSGDTKVENHWTHGSDPPSPQALGVYEEGGNRTFLALAMQARLIGYVRAELQGKAECTHRKDQAKNARRNPECLEKKGRPLLDHALRPLRTTLIAMPCHFVRDDFSIDVDLIALEHDADPTQLVFLYDK